MKSLFKHAKDDYIFLHCLPAHRGEEVTTEIIDGSHSVSSKRQATECMHKKLLLVELL